MGFRSIFSCAVLLAAVSPAALAQESEATPPPVFSLPGNRQPAQPDRQGPEIDVFRAPATPDATPPPIEPPAVQPTITAPPPAPPTAAPDRAAPRPRSVQPAPSAPAAPPPTPEPAPTPPAAASPEAAPATHPVPMAAPDSPTPPKTSAPWGWIAAALALLAALAGGLLWCRRSPAAQADATLADARLADAPGVDPLDDTTATATPESGPVHSPVTLTPVPPPPATGPRPRLALDVRIEAARLTFTGASIGYWLYLRNDGDARAEDIMIHALLANADARQQDTLDRFFAGQDGSVLHSVVAIAPGDTTSLTGELRLSHDAIVPVELGDRTLLIPLIAFDVHYRWDAAQRGRSGGAWIVGQEQEPPAPRLAPLRMDQGPRQFRRPGCRATGITIDA